MTEPTSFAEPRPTAKNITLRGDAVAEVLSTQNVGGANNTWCARTAVGGTTKNIALGGCAVVKILATKQIGHAGD